MKTIKNSAAQGDVVFRRLRKVPKDAKVVSTMGSVVVAHSETGHHHVASGNGGAVALLERTPLLSYLQPGAGVKSIDVVHQRPFDTHETLRLLCNPGDVWEVRRQREHTPEGWRRVED